MQKYSIGQFSKEIGVTPQTLRNWDKTDKLKPSHTSPSGHRYYTHQQLNNYLRLENKGNRRDLNEQDDENIILLIGVLKLFGEKVSSHHKGKINQLIKELELDEQ